MRNIRSSRLVLFALLALLTSPFAAIGLAQEDPPVRVRGRLKAFYADNFATRQCRKYYLLEELDDAGVLTTRTFRLRLDKGAPGQLRRLGSGSVVEVRGKVRGSEIVLASGGDPSGSVEVVEAATTVESGDQNTLVMVVNLADKNVDCSLDSIYSLLFGPSDSVDQVYQATSFGQLSFSGDLVGPYTLEYTSAEGCNYRAWASAADALALADGVDFRLYTRIVYVMPRQSCSFAGAGTIGGNPSQAWIFSCHTPDVYAHELGHNLGMHHASTPGGEYGDLSDLMGISGVGLRGLNSPHVTEMGWLSPERMETVTQSGVYHIAPLHLDPSNAGLPVTTQVLKIAKVDTGDDYYVSYRTDGGFDSNLRDTYRDRTNIHSWEGNGRKTYFLGALGDGESFQDTANGFTITQLSHADTHVTVEVALGCAHNAPGITLSPSAQSGSPGETLEFQTMLTNNDSPDCPASAFQLVGWLPEGWTGSLSPEVLTLSPGETASATLLVASPDMAMDGSYEISLAVSGDGVPEHENSAGATYAVRGDTTPPAAPTIDPVASPTTATQVTLTGTRAEDAVEIRVNESADGVLLPSPGVWEATVILASEGENPFFVTALDGSGNESDAAIVVVVRETSSSPGVSVASPSDGAKVTSSPVTVEVTVDDSEVQVVDVNGIQGEVSNGRCRVDVPLLKGPNTITATARNAEGNLGEASIVVELKGGGKSRGRKK